MEKNSYTNWKNFEPVRYKHCNGSLYCLNPNCLYLQEYVKENFINFDKNSNFDIYSASENFITCEARKYTDFQGNTAYVSHVGSHTCVPKEECKRPSEFVSQGLSIDYSS